MSVFPDAAFLTSAHEPRQFVADTGSEIAFSGRSNAGKSSAINAVLNRRNFARTSKSPGRTQLINFFSLQGDQRLVDLPGYGYARVGKSLRAHWRGLLADYFETRMSLKGLFLIVDSRRRLGDFDWQMLDWTGGIGCPTHVLLTKADKLKRQEARNTLAAVQKELGDIATVQLFSATKGQGVEEARVLLNRLLVAENA
jgi:GTP-binding protein